MKQNKWYNYNQCNPTRSNQKSEARQAIDDAARAKKEAIDQTPDATTEEKEAAKAKSRPSSNGRQKLISMKQ